MPGAEPPALPRRILYYVSSAEGGIAHYSHYQAQELQRRGVDVTMLCGAGFPWRHDQADYRQLRQFSRIEGKSLFARLRRFMAVIGGHYRLAWQIVRQRAKVVLLDANTEYYSLLWIWPHLLLWALGTTYVANFHDPLRKVRYGMPRLHRLELGLFYRTLRGGLIHGEAPAGAWIPRWIDLERVPHGPFSHLAARAAPFDLRERLGIGADRFVLLSFGLIADYKNLDLLIRALPRLPGVELVMAGKSHSASQRPATFYADLASELGVRGRVHLVDAFISEADIPAYFMGCDAVALTYSRSFVSQSGVLQLAVLWEKPLLASSGDGPLRASVTGHGLGLFVEPDSVEAVVDGIRALQQGPGDVPAGFAAYNRASSWQANIDGLARLLGRIGAGG